VTSSPWQPLPMQQASSVFQGPSFMSPPVLFHRRQSQRHLPFLLRGCPRPVWVVLLPLAAGPRGMPRRPQLAAPVARGGQLSAEPPGWLGNISLCLGSCCWCSGLPLPRAPLLRDGLLFIPGLGGCAPWPGREGRVLICLVAAVRGPWPLATSSSFVACSRRWSAPPVRGCYPLLVRSRACYPPSSGGGLR
jgi:hypothetical protein